MLKIFCLAILAKIHSNKQGNLRIFKNKSHIWHNVILIEFFFSPITGKQIQENRGEKRATSYLIQSLSMRVQRGNVASIIGTVGETQKLEEIYDLVTPLKTGIQILEFTLLFFIGFLDEKKQSL